MFIYIFILRYGIPINIFFIDEIFFHGDCPRNSKGSKSISRFSTSNDQELGQVISIIGSSLTYFGIGVWIFEQTGDAMPFVLTVLFGSLPQVFLLPVAGSLADRWNRRWLMILADTGNALATLAIVLLLSFGSLEVWHIYLLSAIGSADLKLGRLGQAEKLLRQATKNDPTFVPAWNNLGVVLMEQGKYGEASRVFTTAFALDSGESAEIRHQLFPLAERIG